MKSATVGSLFTGIGGLDLGLERAGWEVKWQIENDKYCNKVLEKHWPNVRRYGDIKAVDPGGLERVDLICGGFPCQPWSVAGRGDGENDDRNLWPDTIRVIRGVGPRLVLLENSPALLTYRYFGTILGDLAESGYDAEWDCIPAAAVGAPHLRYRLFILAYSSDTSNGHDKRRTCTVFRNSADGSRIHIQESKGIVGNTKGYRQLQQEGRNTQECRWTGNASRWPVEPDVDRVANGVPARPHRLSGLGNAVVPAIAEWLGRRIMNAINEAERLQ